MLQIVEIAYPVVLAGVRPVLRFGLRWSIEGLEQIPQSGGVILASNHISYLDPLVLAVVADKQKRRVRYLAKEELFGKPVLGTFLRSAGQIPVARGSADAAEALGGAVKAVGSGECVVVFPEGTISLDLEPMQGRTGTARLAAASGVDVVPVGLWGAHRILFKGRPAHWRTGVAVSVVIGSPLRIAIDEDVHAATDRLMTAICQCVSRARSIYPQRAGEGDDWWERSPDSAIMRPSGGEA
ncbi:MAG: lysophospholipid acyltransferase family protein [Actinomycetes bacterium]